MKKKILHVLNTGMYSGAENVAITIINNLKNDFDCYYVSLDGPIRDVLIEYNIQFIPIKKLSYKELSRVVNEIRPDIIHAHDFTASTISMLFKGRLKIISHIHHNAPWMKSVCIKSIIYLISSISYSRILTVSSSIVDDYIFKRAILNKVDVIFNPIDIDLIMKKSMEVKGNQKFDLIYLARLCEEKDPIRFIRIVNELVKKDNLKDIRVAIVGDGPLKEKCKYEVKRYNLTDNVYFYGFLSNPYPVLKNSKILCLTSKWEGYGLVAAEALTLSKPVIAPSVGGLNFILNSECGYLCDNDNQYISEIENLLTNYKYYNQKSKNAFNRIKKINHFENYISGLRKIYLT